MWLHCLPFSWAKPAMNPLAILFLFSHFLQYQWRLPRVSDSAAACSNWNIASLTSSQAAWCQKPQRVHCRERPHSFMFLLQEPQILLFLVSLSVEEPEASSASFPLAEFFRCVAMLLLVPCVCCIMLTTEETFMKGRSFFEFSDKSSFTLPQWAPPFCLSQGTLLSAKMWRHFCQLRRFPRWRLESWWLHIITFTHYTSVISVAKWVSPLGY